MFRCGLRVISVDGSTTNLPDSRENAEYLGRPSNATRAGALSQARWSTSAGHGHPSRITVGWAHLRWRRLPDLVELTNRRRRARIRGNDRIVGSDLGYSRRECRHGRASATLTLAVSHNVKDVARPLVRHDRLCGLFQAAMAGRL